MHAMSARPTDSGSACWASGTEMKIEYATAAAGAMCVIDWNSTCGNPIECSRRCSNVRGPLAVPSIAVPPIRLTALRHHRALAGRVLHALLEPRVAAVEQLHRRRVARVVVVRPQIVEEPVAAAARLQAEQVRELTRRVRAIRALIRDRVRVDDRRGGREQLGAD